ncbi:MAG: tetratricopeptide repeat protein, partial [Deltaproteobacteria bacterium]|nr:tetratricopeptide repeat protein [Deltaproteobacteria bacterium]
VLAVIIAVLLGWPFPAMGQVPDVGPSGCVRNCPGSGSGGGGSRGRSGGGGGYDPYADMAVSAFGAFMHGFMQGIQQANDPKRRATALNNKGVQFFKAGNYAEAIRYYEAALRLNPNSHVTRNNLKNARRKYKEQQKELAEKRRLEAQGGRA